MMNPHWEPLFKTYYETYFQELASEALVLRWQKFDIVTGILVAATATSSAVAGWTLWTNPGWAVIWAIIAGTASLASIIHGSMTVPTRIKDQGTARISLSQLRIQLETCLNQIIVDAKKGVSTDLKNEYDSLRTKYAECIRGIGPDFAFTEKLRIKVQKNLNDRL